jgi:hypothetical protein
VDGTPIDSKRVLESVGPRGPVGRSAPGTLLQSTNNDDLLFRLPRYAGRVVAKLKVSKGTG